MATETGISESVCLKKDEKEDNALSSEILEEKVTELPVNKVKQLESGPNQPLETSSQVAETVYTQLDTSKPTNESGTFFEALSVSMVTSNTPESCKATITEDQDKRKTTETETLYERKPNDDERVEAVSTQTEPEEENIQREVKYDDEATIEKEACEETAESEVVLKHSDSKSSKKEALEKDQGNNDDVTSSQYVTYEDIKEMTTSQNATIVADFKERDPSEKPSDFLKEETKDIIHDAKEASELCENGAEDNSEQKPKECVKKIEQEEEIEEIRPGVYIEENIEQNGLLHDITADACISTQTKSQVETKEHEEKDEEEAEKSDNPLIKEVSKEIGPEKAVYHETEQEDNMQEKEQAENDVTSVQDLTFEGGLEEKNQNSEGNECEIVKAKQNIEEDAEENRSSIETPEEMEQERLINVVPVDVCISTKTEPEEETTENNIEKNDEAIERDDGQMKKSGSLMVEKILEETVSEKAESEEGLKLPESDQEKEHKLNVSEKGQGDGDEITCSQNATRNDIKETNAVISEEIPKEEAVDRSIDAEEARELCENGAKDNIEQTPKESVTEIEEIRPGVEIEEKVEQNGFLHDSKADACISTQTKSEVETTEHEENDEEEAEKSDSPLIKEVSEEIGLEKAEYHKEEQEVSELKKDGDDEKEQEVNTLKEDTEKIRSSIETPEEMEQQPLINVIPTDICVSTKTELDEETSENIEKNDEEAIENDDGQTNKSGSLVVEKIHEDVVSEKAESEEGLKLPESSNEIVSKDEDQEEEQELNVSDKGQGGGDEITSSQNASSDDIKETNAVISAENLKEEAEDRSIDAQEVCAQYEDVTKDNREQKPDETVNRTAESSSTNKQEEYTQEIEPSVEPNEEKSVCISTKTESQDEATKDEQKEIESDGDQKEKSDNSLVKEVCDDNNSKEILLLEEKDEKRILILRKDEDQEKEQELDMSEKDQEKDEVTCSQDTTAVSEEDLQEKNHHNEGTEPEVVDAKESIKEGTKEVRSSDKTPEKIEQPTDVCISTHTEIEEKNDEEAVGEICPETVLEKAEPEEGLKPSDENEIVSIDEDQEKEQKHSLSKKSQGGEDDVTSSQNASDKDTIETMISQHVTTEAYFEEGQGLSAMPKEIFKEEADEKSIEAQEASEQYEDGALDKEQKPEESVNKFQESCSIVEQEDYTEEIKPNFDANEEKEEEATKNEENDIENDSDKKENSNNSIVKEVSEETELKNTETEENVNISDSSNINLDEKTVAILSKDEDERKEHELKDAIAVSEEDLQEKNYSGESDEREFVETRESIPIDIEKNDEDQQEDNYHNKGNEPVVVNTKDNEVEDTEEIKSSVETNKTTETKPEEETTEKIVEEAIENHDDQTKKSEILLVEEVCEATSLEKAESEEGLKHSDSFSTTLDEDDKVNKEVDVEKDRDLKTSNFIGGENDVISSQNVANKDIKETEIGEHATTEAYFEEGYSVSATVEEIIEEEAEDKSIDGQEASENCQKAKESNKSSVNSGSEVAEGAFKEDEADAGNNKEIKAMLDAKIQDDMTEDRSVTKKMSTDLEQPKERIVEEIQASQTEIVSDKTEEEITKNDEDLSCDKIEDTNGSTTTEEKVYSDGRENESVEERTCSLDKVSGEKIIDVNETTAVEPQEDNTPSNSLRTSTNDTSNSEKAKAESENMSIDNLESVSEVQIPEVGPTSEELKVNEECLISATKLQVDEEKGTVKEDILTDAMQKTEEATEIKQETFEEACEETISEKAELEEGLKSSDSSNMEINEKVMTTFKDEDQEKDQEVDILIKGQGKDDVTSSCDAAFKEEDLQEKSYESEDGFVITAENVDKDTEIINSSVETKESESESSLFKEACEATSSDKAESEDVVEHSESSDAKLDENEIVSKEENQEKEPIDAQEASDQCENGENDKSGQHDEESVNVPVTSCAENVEGNITEDEAGAGEEKDVEAKLDAENQVDRTDDTSEIKDEGISTENISRETIAVEPQEDIKPSSSLGKSTEDISDLVKPKPESDNLPIEDLESVSEVQVPEVVPKSEDSEIETYVDEEKGTATTQISSNEQPEKSHITTEENVTRLQLIGENDSSYEKRDLEEDVTQESQLDSTEDCSDIVNDVILTDEVSLEIQKEKEINDFKEQITGEASYSQNEKEMAHEISYSDPISVENPELTEDLQAAEDISCQSKVRNDSVDEASKEKSISSLEDAATSEPQVYLSNIESTAYPSESEKLPTQALESVCDVQTTEVIVDSEDSKVKEESIVLKTVGYTDETEIEDELNNKSNEILSSADTEEENVKQASKKSEEAKRSDLNIDETVLIKKNRELHGELEITSESMTEEDQVNETTPQPEQPDITSESIIYDQTLDSKLEHTNEKDLEDVKRDIEEDVTLAPENQIKGVDETTKTVSLTDEVEVETEKDNESNEVKEQVSEEDNGTTEELNNASTPNQIELANEIELSKLVPGENTEVTELQAEREIEPENMQVAEDISCVLDASSTIIGEVKDRSVEEALKDDVIPVQENSKASELLVSIPETELIDTPANGQDSMKLTEGISCSTQETIQEKSVLISQLTDKESLEEKNDKLISEVQTPEEHQEVTNDTCDSTLTSGVSSEKLLDETEENDAKEDIEVRGEVTEKVTEESCNDAVAKVMVHERFEQTEEKLVSMVPPEELTPPMDKEQTHELVLETDKANVEHNILANKDQYPELVEEEFTKTISEEQSIKERYFEEEGLSNFGIENKETSRNIAAEDVIVNVVLLEDETAKESKSIKDDINEEIVCNQLTSATDEVSQIERSSSISNELLETKDPVEDIEDPKLMAENLKLKDETFTVMKEPNEESEILAPEVGSFENMVTEEKTIKTDESREKETLDEPHADDLPKATSDSISSFTEQDMVVKSESRGHGDLSKLEEKPNEVLEVTTEVVEIVAEGQEASTIMTDNFQEASSKMPPAKHELEITTTTEELEDKIKDKEVVCLPVEKTETLQVSTLISEIDKDENGSRDMLNKENEALQPQERISKLEVVDPPTDVQAPHLNTKQALLEFVDQESQREQQKEADENIEAGIPIEDVKNLTREPEVKSVNLEVPSVIDAAADKAGYNEDPNNMTDNTYEAVKGVVKEDQPLESSCDTVMKQEPLDVDAPATLDTAAVEDLNISQKYVIDDLIKKSQTQPEIPKYEVSTRSVDKQSPNEPLENESKLLTENIDASQEHDELTAKSLIAEVEEKKVTQVSTTEPQYSSEVLKEEKKTSNEKEKSESAEPTKILFSDILHERTKETSEVTENLIGDKQTLQTKDQQVGKEENGEGEVKTDEESEGEVIVEASKDTEEVKVPKKSHSILSGVGSKVKHSLAKVKKAITGKSSHSKPPSP